MSKGMIADLPSNKADKGAHRHRIRALESVAMGKKNTKTHPSFGGFSLSVGIAPQINGLLPKNRGGVSARKPGQVRSGRGGWCPRIQVNRGRIRGEHGLR